MVEDMKTVLSGYLPLREVVFRTIRRSILSGELAPGERLMENQLAEQLGVSRTPIREAIRKLELEGLVTMVPRKGAQVANISIEDIKDVLTIRASLEGLASKLACENISEEDLNELIKVNDEFSEIAAEKDVEKIVKWDIKLHDIIFQASNNQKLATIINNLREQIYRYRIEYVYNIKDFSHIVHEHNQIVQAIIDRDVKKAEEYAINHIRHQEEEVVRLLKGKI